MSPRADWVGQYAYLETSLGVRRVDVLKRQTVAVVLPSPVSSHTHVRDFSTNGILRAIAEVDHTSKLVYLCLSLQML